MMEAEEGVVEMALGEDPGGTPEVSPDISPNASPAHIPIVKHSNVVLEVADVGATTVAKEDIQRSLEAKATTTNVHQVASETSYILHAVFNLYFFYFFIYKFQLYTGRYKIALSGQN